MISLKQILRNKDVVVGATAMEFLMQLRDDRKDSNDGHA